MKTRFTFTTALLVLLTPYALKAQSDSIDVWLTVSDSMNNTPLIYAPVAVLNATGERQAMFQTDESGQVHFQVAAGSEYRLDIRYLGYADTLVSLPKTQAGTLRIQVALPPSSIILQGVTVRAAKPTIRYDAGKLILSVSNTPFAEGSNILEVLQKAPGVSTNLDGALSFRGKQGVLVLVDNKNIYVSGEDLSRYLETIPSSEVEQIEIISNPSARFDASGNIGVINIVTKKSKEKHLNGSVQGSATYGEHFRPAGSLMLNARPSEQWGFYGSYNYAGGKTLTINNSRREIASAGAPFVFDQGGDRISNKTDNRVKAGLDFDNGKHLFGCLFNGFYTQTDIDNQSLTQIQRQQTDSLVQFRNQSDNNWKNLSGNANYQWRIDSIGQLLDVNLDAAGFRYSGMDKMESRFLLPDGNPLRSAEVLRNSSPSKVQIWSAKFDYTYPFKPRNYIQTGAKFSRADTDNDLVFELQQNGTWALDPKRSNHFLFDEDIAAAYIDFYDYSDAGWDYGIGLRTEYSISKGNNLTIDSAFTRTIFQLFPSGYVRKFFGKNSLMLSYNKRIDRPDYNSLNPFVFYIDNYSFWQGNTALKPQLSHTADLSYSFNQQLFVNLFHTHTRDVFMQFPIQNDTEKTVFNTVQNIGSSDYTGLSVSLYKSLKPWWYFAGTLTGSYTNVKDTRENGSPGVDGFQGYFNAYNGFSLPAQWRMDLSLTVNLPNRSFWYTKGYSAVSIGVSKSFKQSTLSLYLNDIFNQSRYRSSIDYQNLNIKSYYKPETRTIRLSFSYPFGNNKIKQQRDRQTGMEEELKRVKN
ncbi:MAG: TonB-dependent receptor [Saprospiraceae bacterium]|nr:TonB-dependent receptor [Saprospiraceae bacterium]